MPTTTLGGFLQRLKGAMAAEALAANTDGELLDRFLAAHDEAAFAALLSRHGPMVYRVCRRMLTREQDAEDAFQATFLVLAREVRTIRKRASLASWLHGVAHRIALEARDGAARRCRHESLAGTAARPATLTDELTWKELRSVLDEELVRLPHRLRTPLVLCFLEGLTQDEAARQIGCSVSTFRRNLARGREVLAARLARRGVTLSAGLFAPLLTASAASAAVPATLVAAALRAVTCGRTESAAAAGVIPARVLALTEGVVRTMWVKTLTVTAAVMLACVTGAGVAYRGLAADESPTAKANAPAEVPRRPLTPAADSHLEKVLESALKDAEAIENAFDRTAAFCGIARAHARAGRGEVAADVLRTALEAESRETGVIKEQHKENRLWIIAESQAETGDVKGALETIDGGISEANRTSALRYVATAQARAGDIKGALATVERMQPVGADDPFRPDALGQIAVIQAEAGDSKGALATAERIGGGPQNKAFALAAIVAARVKAGDKEGAAKLLDPIRELVPETGTPRNFGLAALAEALAATGMAEDAIKTAKDIAEPQWRDRALGRIAAGQAARGEVKAARRTAEVIEDGYRKGKALKEVVTALTRAKDLHGAVKAAADIGDDIGRCYALMEVAKGQAAAGQKAEAQRTLREALQLADRLENPRQMSGVREAALAHYAGARAAAGDPEGALEWAGKQEDRWVRTMARVRVVEALAATTRK